jgi:hypothetical protein
MTAHRCSSLKLEGRRIPGSYSSSAALFEDICGDPGSSKGRDNPARNKAAHKAGKL